MAMLALIPACKAQKAKPRPRTSPKIVIHKPIALSAETKVLAYNIGLSTPHFEALEKNGFVVSPAPKRYGVTPSNIYDEIYQRDLPVFITSDSILYAFHRSYVEYLAHLEIKHLEPMVHKLLMATRRSLAKAVSKKKLSPEQKRFAEDLDLYLSVPLYLLDAVEKPRLKTSSRVWLEETIEKIKAEKTAPLNIFTQTLDHFDFSRFKPRGHYAKHRELRTYFKVMTWLNQIPIELTKSQGQAIRIHREGFEQAALLSLLIEKSGQLQTHRSLVKVLNAFVGPADDEGPQEMLGFLGTRPKGSGFSLSSIKNTQIEAWLQSSSGQRSRIVSQRHQNTTFKPNQPVSRSFYLLGQRHMLDSEVFQNLVFDRIKDPKDPKRAVLRKLPKSLDIMAALGNPRAKTHLKSEFERYPYEHALTAQTQRIAALPKSAWTQNVHSAWLAAIASLHQSKHKKSLPALFQSPAWEDKTLQTQLASWAELRHDHLLYGKQSHTVSIQCEFTGAYVEPVPEFFGKMKVLISLQHAHIDELEKLGFRVDKRLHDRLLHFSNVLDTLHGIALKEVEHLELSAQEKHFLKQAVEQETVGCGSLRWDGWYPRLMGVDPKVGFEPTIADVHVDPPDDANGWQRRFLYAATGKFELATIVMDCPQKKQCLYVGPVSSFFEFVDVKRIDDQSWWQKAYQGEPAGRPEWTHSFRVEALPHATSTP